MPRIVRVDKPGWTVYYDCEVRYPVCVVETFRGSLPGVPIRRKDMGEPFRADTALPKEARMYWREYEDYMTYGGGSPGHNAPASFHKSGVSDYRRTFLLSNVCPQDAVFNAGLWLLLEALCREIIAAFPRVDILTGSLRGADRRFGASTVHVPSGMFKVIVATTRSGKRFAGAYIMPNAPATDERPVDAFFVPIEKACGIILGAAGFDLTRILSGAERAPSLGAVHALRPAMTKELRNQMRGARTYGALIHARTIKDLDRAFAAIRNPGPYHVIYYDRAKTRILAER
eukprot:jgi/Tetstr1/454272/TSEL_041191.t1